jgi:hypothetical protein
MNWIKVPNSQFIRILEKCPDRDSNQGSIGYSRWSHGCVHGSTAVDHELCNRTRALEQTRTMWHWSIAEVSGAESFQTLPTSCHPVRLCRRLSISRQSWENAYCIRKYVLECTRGVSSCCTTTPVSSVVAVVQNTLGSTRWKILGNSPFIPDLSSPRDFNVFGPIKP